MKNLKNLLRNKKALSPVIATVILVAVTIVVAVSVAYWMGSIASSYTAFEQIDIPTSYPEWNTTGWKVHVELKNSGSADATINNIFLNQKPLKDYLAGNIEVNYTMPDGSYKIADLQSIGISIHKGSTVKVIVYIADVTEGCSHGTNVNLKLHSAAGYDYTTQVKLT